MPVRHLKSATKTTNTIFQSFKYYKAESRSYPKQFQDDDEKRVSSDFDR